jgi:hypothetical protein
MSSEQIYLAARDCARSDLSKDLASPIDWRKKPGLIDHLRAGLAARTSARSSTRAAEQGKSD